MMEQYITLARPGRDEFTVQKSRFIGQAFPCLTEEEALLRLKEVRENSRDARHHCYAYVIGLNEGIIRYSDDGEPGGTAGQPILSLIRAERIVNCCVVVTRYFGGILLGTGGLVRAYSQGCRIALDAAGIVSMERTSRYLCEVPYSCWDSVHHAMDHLPVRCLNPEFAAAVSFTLLVRTKDREQALHELDQISGRTMETLLEEEKYDAWEV